VRELLSFVFFRQVLGKQKNDGKKYFKICPKLKATKSLCEYNANDKGENK
jgi:hypothetical protein